MEGYLPSLSEPARRWVRFLFLLAALVAVGLLAYRLRAVLTPVAAAAALAYVFNPLVTRLERRGKRDRLFVVVVIFVVAGLMLLCAGVVLVTQGIVQLSYLAERLPAYYDRALHWITGMSQFWSSGVGTAANTAVNSAVGAATTTATSSAPAAVTQPSAVAGWALLAPLLKSHGPQFASSLATYAASVLSSAAAIASILVLIPLFAFYFLWQGPAYVQFIEAHLPAPYRPQIVHVARTIDRATSSFFRGRLIVCAAIGVLTAVGWSLVGVPYGILLGVLAGVLSLVPFMSLLALPLALVLTYLENPTAWVYPELWTMAVYVIVQMLESFVLSPLVEGRASGLHPLAIVLALLIGGELAGLLGLLLAIPVASTLRTLAAEMIWPEIQRWAGQAPPPAGPTTGP